MVVFFEAMVGVPLQAAQALACFLLLGDSAPETAMDWSTRRLAKTISHDSPELRETFISLWINHGESRAKQRWDLSVRINAASLTNETCLHQHLAVDNTKATK